MSVGSETKPASLVCCAAACKLTAFNVYTKIVRTGRQLRRFDFSCYGLGLAELVRWDLNELAKVRNVGCKCVSTLARCV